ERNEGQHYSSRDHYLGCDAGFSDCHRRLLFTSVGTGRLSNSPTELADGLELESTLSFEKDYAPRKGSSGSRGVRAFQISIKWVLNQYRCLAPGGRPGGRP